MIEVIGVTAALPFIAVISDTSNISKNHYFYYVYNLFGFQSHIKFIIFLGILVIAFYLIRALYTIVFQYIKNRFLANISNDLSNSLFQKNINMPYIEFIEKKVSNIYDTVIWKSFGVNQSISNLLTIIVEIFTCLMISAILLIFHPIITILIILIMVSVVYLLIKLCIKKLKFESNRQLGLRQDFYDILFRSFGNFKLVKLISNEIALSQQLETRLTLFSISTVFVNVLQQLPKVIMELSGFSILIGVSISYIYVTKETNSVIPLLAMFTVAFYKFLPSLNNITSCYNQIFSNFSVIEAVRDDLQQFNENFDNIAINFDRNLELKNICFEYKTSKSQILKNINLQISRGDKVAFIGESGGGKTTLVDVIMGIYLPSSGGIFIDDVELNHSNLKDWKSKIGYIPQHIYLFNGSVAENVSFGYDLDNERVIECLKLANIYDFFEKLDGINTQIGEAGINISGGQKQRVGIARALYSNPEIIVLDEATSALDSQTESIIMDEIYRISKDKTLLVIAHRLSTIDGCNKVVTLDNGQIINLRHVD